MVLFWLTVAGILFIILGNSTGASALTPFGIYLLFPIVIFIIVKVLKKIYDENRRRQWEEERIAREIAEKRKKEEDNQKALREQQQLIEKFKISPLTKEIVHAVCFGDQQLPPEKIVITYNCIQGERSGQTVTYDFASHRVHSPFSPVIRTISNNEELKYVIKPQIAMAEALNSLFGYAYVIYDNAKQNVNYHTDCDGDSWTSITYVSDHVTMVLKTTLPNRQF